jgi:hypothetical protein
MSFSTARAVVSAFLPSTLPAIDMGAESCEWIQLRHGALADCMYAHLKTNPRKCIGVERYFGRVTDLCGGRGCRHDDLTLRAEEQSVFICSCLACHVRWLRTEA